MGLIQSINTRTKSDFDLRQQGVGQIKPIKISHTWTIANFKNCCDMLPHDEQIVSPVFSTGDNDCYKWRLILNPRGEDNKGEYVSLYLQMVTSDQSLTLKSKFSLSIINKNGECVNKCWSLQEQCCFVGDKTIWGFKQFIKLDELLEVRNNKFLQEKGKKADLVIFVTNECEETDDVIPQQCDLLKMSVTENILDASKDFKTLLQNGKLSDLAIISSDGQEFRAHKVILAARSPVFAAMFEHDMSEKNSNVIVVEDIRGDIMREVLCYLYSGKVNNLEANGQELLAAAEKYALNGLEYTCEQVLISAVTADTAFELFIFADMYNATNLKNQMRRFIIDHSKEIVQTQSFKTIKTSRPELVAEIFEKMVLQNDFFDAHDDCNDDQ